MSIADAKKLWEKIYFGGSADRVSSVDITLGIYEKRVQVIEMTASSKDVIIPDADTIPTNRIGGPYYYILNVAAAISFDIVTNDGFSFTLAAGEALSLFCTSAGWGYRHSTVGGGTIIPPQNYWGNSTLDATLSDLVGVWKINDLSGGLVEETAGGRTLAKGGSGGTDTEYQESGIDEYAIKTRNRYFIHSGTLSGVTNNFTIACWHKYTGTITNTYSYPMLYWNSNNYQQFRINGNAGTKNNNAFSMVNGSFDYILNSASYTSADWHLLLISRVGNISSFYVDDVLIGTKTQSGFPTAVNPKLVINDGFLTGFVDGDQKDRIDEITIWKTDLSSAERTALWNAGSGRFYVEP